MDQRSNVRAVKIRIASIETSDDGFVLKRKGGRLFTCFDNLSGSADVARIDFPVLLIPEEQPDSDGKAGDEKRRRECSERKNQRSRFKIK